jgi:hypothetical protein
MRRLADALHSTGRQRAARELFERLLNPHNDLRLLAEEYDPASGRHLGNTPDVQSRRAYQHRPTSIDSRGRQPSPASPVGLKSARLKSAFRNSWRR